MVAGLTKDTLAIKAKGIDLPESEAEIIEIDFKARKIKSPDRALASLAVMAKKNRVISLDMLKAALEIRFKGKTLQASLSLVDSLFY